MLTNLNNETEREIDDTIFVIHGRSTFFIFSLALTVRPTLAATIRLCVSSKTDVCTVRCFSVQQRSRLCLTRSYFAADGFYFYFCILFDPVMTVILVVQIINMHTYSEKLQYTFEVMIRKVIIYN